MNRDHQEVDNTDGSDCKECTVHKGMGKDKVGKMECLNCKAIVVRTVVGMIRKAADEVET